VHDAFAEDEKTTSASLLLWFALIAFVISIMTWQVTPNVLRDNMAANEASAMASVRTIERAAVSYSRQHPDKGYPQRLPDLLPYLDSALANGVKSGYVFQYRPQPRDPDGVVRGFTVEATPMLYGQTGQRHFAADEGGEVSGLRAR
jgi:competence protein ComGC